MNPKPLTMQTAALFEEWAAKISAVIEASHRPRITAMITAEAEQDPQFAEALKGLLAGNVDTNDILTTWVSSNPVNAARLHRVTSELPMSIAALRLAIECILETCEKPEEVNVDAVTYEEARAYCAKILDMTT